MKVRKFMPLIAAALVAVLTLAIGAGTGSARTDVKQAPAAFKVALVTDIGGLDDRSFNFLANKGLQQAKKELKVEGRVFISKSNADYVPNLTTAARGGYNLIISVGFLMGDATAQVAKRFPKTKFAIIDNSGVGRAQGQARRTCAACSSRSRRPATSSATSPASQSKNEAEQRRRDRSAPSAA